MPREHLIEEGGDCWCFPTIEWLCPSCLGDGSECSTCGGEGFIQDDDVVENSVFIPDGTPKITYHRDIEVD